MAIMDLSADHYQYLCEGGLNIVLAIKHSSSSLLSGNGHHGQVIRLNKDILRAAAATTTTATGSVSTEQAIVHATALATQRLHSDRAYICDVLLPLLGDHHVDAGTITFVPSAIVAEILRACEPLRPHERLADASSASAPSFLWPTIPVVLMRDYTYLPSSVPLSPPSSSMVQWTWCVELKPKWGYLIQSPSLSSVTSAVKRRVCRYCMMQYYKAKNKSHTSTSSTSTSSSSVSSSSSSPAMTISGYCPLDLFSGVASRIERAITALIRTPQNNFRLFARCNQSTPVNIDVTNDADVMLTMQRMYPHRSFTSVTDARHQLITTITSLICRGNGDVISLLRRIRHAQHLLDSYDIELIINVWNHLVAASAATTRSDTEPTKDTVVNAMVARVDRLLRHDSTDASHWRQSLGQQLRHLVRAIDDPSSPPSHQPTKNATVVTPHTTIGGDEQKTILPAIELASSSVSSGHGHDHAHAHWQQCMAHVGVNTTPVCENAAIVERATTPSSSSSTPIVTKDPPPPTSSTLAATAVTIDTASSSWLPSLTDDVLRHFIIAATLKDLSIMMAFAPPPSSPASSSPLPSSTLPLSSFSASSGSSSSNIDSWLCQCWVADLDVKPVAKIPTYWQQDHDIVHGYIAKFGHAFIHC